MTPLVENSDLKVLELLRQFGSLGISELVDKLGVTTTAVRQRMDRLLVKQWVERREEKAARGRPGYRFALTDRGQRMLGNNLSDLASVLWQEINQIDDSQVRNSLLQKIANRLAGLYGGAVEGGDPAERLAMVVQNLRANQLPVSLEKTDNSRLPVLQFNGCPYPDLSRDDHGICEVETSMLTAMAGVPIRLRECRCDSATGCCTYELVEETLGVQVPSPLVKVADSELVNH